MTWTVFGSPSDSDADEPCSWRPSVKVEKKATRIFNLVSRWDSSEIKWKRLLIYRIYSREKHNCPDSGEWRMAVPRARGREWWELFAAGADTNPGGDSRSAQPGTAGVALVPMDEDQVPHAQAFKSRPAAERNAPGRDWRQQRGGEHPVPAGQWLIARRFPRRPLHA